MGLLIVSFFNLGKSFGFIPAVRPIIYSGLYEYVRHPIYSGYIYLFASYCALYPSATNLAGLVALFYGLYMRSLAEEDVLNTELEYRICSPRVTRRFLRPLFSLPLTLQLSIIAYSDWLGKSV
jgi:protein-S-isoprenylcysteine O-methyltransferase Ste14